MDSPHLSFAHKHCFQHRAELEANEICGYFYCLSTFPPAAIKEWIKRWIKGGQTALCPNCSVDAVLGSASGLPITQKFLKLMHEQWF